MDWLEDLLNSVKDSNYGNVKDLLKDTTTDVLEVPSESPLILAIDKNDIEMVRLLGDYKWHIKGGGDFQPNPIINATIKTYVDSGIVEALVQSKSEVNGKDRQGHNALHLAAKYNYVEKLEFLLQCPRLNTSAVDNYGKNVLHHLIEGTRFENIEEFKRCAMLILEKDVDINAQDKMEETPLHKVFQFYSDFIPQIITFLFQNAKDINHELKDKEGLTIFHIIVSNVEDKLEQEDNFDKLIEEKERLIHSYLSGKIVDISSDVVTRLLNEPNIRGDSAFQTYIDSEHFSIETIVAMIEFGAEVNATNNIGITPLMHAILRKRDDVVDLLLTSGADVNKTDIFGQTAIFRTRTEHSFDSLCEYGAEIDVKDVFGRSPLANGWLYTPLDLPSVGLTLRPNLSLNHPLAIRFLEHGVSVNTTDRYGSTLLHYAAWYSNLNMIQILLEKGARKDLIDRHGYTPYDLAVHHGNFEAFPFLEIEPSLAVGTSVTENQNRYADYVRFVIHHREADDMESTLQLVGVEDNAEDLIRNLMSSPRTALTDRLSESLKIKDNVHELMNRITKTVSEMDSRFLCTLFPTGSSAEGSQISDPIEMDFVFCLTYFNKECEVVQSEDLLNTGFAQLRLKEYHESHPLIMFIDNDDILRSDLIRERFQDLCHQCGE